MEVCKELTIGQMTRRILRYIPELDFVFVSNRLRAYSKYGMAETDVHKWLQFFDHFVIDERGAL